MTKSTHKVEVVPVVLEPHPNADTLSVVRVFGGFTACVRTADWKPGMLGAYIPPDSLIDTRRPEFQFLADGKSDMHRIKVKRLRGIVSMGLLIPAPEGSQIGDDVAEQLGVTHYEPPPQISTGGDNVRPPAGYHPVYDIDNLRRFVHAFREGEPVWITEKIHGANGRWCFVDGQMFTGSRTEWKKEAPEVVWWKALEARPEIREWCQAHPGWTLYGEVYGRVQDLRYGLTGVEIMVFDLLSPEGAWADPAQAAELGNGLPWVPLIAQAPFDLARILEYAEGPSLVTGASHVREGCVVKPVNERTDPEIGRVILKVIGNGYLERA
ncbi:MAG: RNA ligase family protein [Bryobacteraceae bacterium]